jgi:tetratricopeptide (TPR) repeat protein
MSRRKKKQQDETLIDIVEVSGQAQGFIEKNQKTIIGVATGILVLVGAYFGYKTFILAPKQKEAIQQMAQAQMQFQQDSFAAALENPGGGYPGFLDMIDQYGGTASGNSAKYYAGISYLNLGRFDDAIEYLNKYSAKDDITEIMKFGALGDCYAEQGNISKALSMYKKASSVNANEFLIPYYLKKYALLSNREGNKADALASFERIKKEFPKSSEGLEVDKYISFLGN